MTLPLLLLKGIHFYFVYMSKDEAVKLLRNAVLTKEGGTL